MQTAATVQVEGCRRKAVAWKGWYLTVNDTISVHGICDDYFLGTCGSMQDHNCLSWEHCKMLHCSSDSPLVAILQLV